MARPMSTPTRKRGQRRGNGPTLLPLPHQVWRRGEELQALVPPLQPAMASGALNATYYNGTTPPSPIERRTHQKQIPLWPHDFHVTNIMQPILVKDFFIQHNLAIYLPLNHFHTSSARNLRTVLCQTWTALPPNTVWNYTSSAVAKAELTRMGELGIFWRSHCP